MKLTWRVADEQLSDLEAHLLKLSTFEGFQRSNTRTDVMLMVTQNYARLQLENAELQKALARVQVLAQSAFDEPEFSKDILRSLIHTTRGVEGANENYT